VLAVLGRQPRGTGRRVAEADRRAARALTVGLVAVPVGQDLRIGGHSDVSVVAEHRSAAGDGEGPVGRVDPFHLFS
jgi:hypothetical protein